MSIEDTSSECIDGSEARIAIPVFDRIISVVLYNLKVRILCALRVAKEVVDKNCGGKASNFGQMVETMHVISLK